MHYLVYCAFPCSLKWIIHKSGILTLTRYTCHSFRISHFLLSWSPSFAFSFQLCLNLLFPHILVFQMVAFSLHSPFFRYPKFVNLWNQVKETLKGSLHLLPYPSQTIPTVSSECQWNQKQLQNKFSDLFRNSFRNRFICLWICNVKCFKNTTLFLKERIKLFKWFFVL